MTTTAGIPLSSPDYIHTNENPSLEVVDTPAMRLALISKKKLVFVDGTIPVPKADDPMHVVWEQCNTMVLTWLLNMLSPPIAQSVH